MRLRLLEVAAIDLTIYNFILPLMKQLKKHGVEIECAASDMGTSEKIEKEGFRIHNIEIKRKIDPISNIRSIVQLYFLIKRRNIDVVHVHTPIASVLARIAGKLAGVKCIVYTVHGFYISNEFLYLIEKLMARYCTDYILTVNDEDRKFAIENKFISQERIININSVGVDTVKFNPESVKKEDQIEIRRKFDIQDDDKVIGYVGRIVKEKGILDLLNSFAVLKSKYGKVKLLIVGSSELGERDNSTMDQIKRIIDENRLTQQVLFAGQRDDVKEMLSVMDIFVLPSYREGMPISLLEAMSMERCVIATDIRGCRDEIDSDSGVLYDAGDVDALTCRIGELLYDESRCMKLGNNARNRVKLLFEQEKVINRQMKLFEKLL